MERKPELLIPAGSMGVLETAVKYGADAVYIGGEAFGLRAKAHNFSPAEMAEAVACCHARGVRVYVTANIFAGNDDLAGIREYFTELKDIRPDALIISDPGVFSLAKEILPDMEIHISTQSNNTNAATFRFWHGLGAKRVVSARELSLRELKEIRRDIPDDCEIETFVHGAMCISYSGRCLLSSFLAGRNANRGECSHPCRWKYSLVEEKRPGEYFPVEENDRGTYIFNSRDLCMIDHMPDLLSSGIDSFKIEGRMKTALYVATVARTYRLAIDDCLRGEEIYKANLSWYRAEIAKCTCRDFTTGFFYGKPGTDAQIYDGNTYQKNYIYLGTALDGTDGERIFLEQKNKFCVGDEAELMKADGRNVIVSIRKMVDALGAEVTSCPHPQEKICAYYDVLRVEEMPAGVQGAGSPFAETGDILRMRGEEMQ